MNEILEVEKIILEAEAMSVREKFDLRIGAVVNEFFKDCEVQEKLNNQITGAKQPENKTLYGKLLVSLENADAKEIES